MASPPASDRVAALIPAIHVIHRFGCAFAASGDSGSVTHFPCSRDEAVREIEANRSGYAGSGDALVPSLETARMVGTGIDGRRRLTASGLGRMRDGITGKRSNDTDEAKPSGEAETGSADGNDDAASASHGSGEAETGPEAKRGGKRKRTDVRPSRPETRHRPLPKGDRQARGTGPDDRTPANTARKRTAHRVRRGWRQRRPLFRADDFGRPLARAPFHRAPSPRHSAPNQCRRRS